jgi:hypothetical protein
MNKTKLRKMIKEELSAVLENYDERDPLDELESIAAEFEEVAALSPSAMIQRRLRELIERLRNALETHRDQWGSDPN